MEVTKGLAVDSLGEWKRSHGCGELRISHLDQEVTLMGWVNQRRDLGGLIFIDLRDRTGLVQIVLDPKLEATSHEKAKDLHNEYVIAVRGRVARREKGQENPRLATGDIEVKAYEIRILNTCKALPFPVDLPKSGHALDASEILRLQYRYLEMRRPQVLERLIFRHRVAQITRNYFNKIGFLEIETPFLTKSTPEGARDYIVPSRLQKGKFYALPQSPQLFKQILMVGGIERYYQIVRCFRDEDLRADRQPEFTQIDVEMSFVTESDVMMVFEGLMVELFRDALGIQISVPFRRLRYKEALESYGTDKPDLRFPLKILDVTESLALTDFRIIRDGLQRGEKVKGICIKGKADLFSRKRLDELESRVKALGGKGLFWIKVQREGIQSPIAKFMNERVQKGLIKSFAADIGDTILMLMGEGLSASKILGTLRLELAKDLGLINTNSFEFLWVVEFPLLEYDEEEKRLVAVHHPFTAPMEEDLEYLNTEPERVRARSYDLVLNGTEIGGGSIRIHTKDMQKRVFEALKISEEEAKAKFGFLLEALSLGAPPHGGMAIGFDRLVAMMLGLGSIRDVIAFPKTTSGSCPLTEAPSSVTEEQLAELGLCLKGMGS